MRNASEIERAVEAVARSANGGLVVTGSPSGTVHRDLIIRLAARNKLPAVYFGRFFVTAGGLISYGTDFPDQYRRAAATSIVSSKARRRLTFRYKHRPS